jgi:hypothetical protein
MGQTANGRIALRRSSVCRLPFQRVRTGEQIAEDLAFQGKLVLIRIEISDGVVGASLIPEDEEIAAPTAADEVFAATATNPVAAIIADESIAQPVAAKNQI